MVAGVTDVVAVVVCVEATAAVVVACVFIVFDVVVIFAVLVVTVDRASLEAGVRGDEMGDEGGPRTFALAITLPPALTRSSLLLVVVIIVVVVVIVVVAVVVVGRPKGVKKVVVHVGKHSCEVHGI